jgi:GTPase SAR1 family protein
VVVGDQSSGKSSLLEILTGFSFPQSNSLCTRYATQISCKRTAEESIVVSIIPHSGTSKTVSTIPGTTKHGSSSVTNDELIALMQQANRLMNIRTTPGDTDPNLRAFSDDLLKIEISGPTQEHFTVIDVPGIFHDITPGLTMESDIMLVENMVKSYMENSRTIVLAVLSSNIDISTQKVLKLARAADPTGTRTMAILTKPDLVPEKVNRETLKNLVLGKSNQLRLGYHIVKNRSADDQTSTLPERLAQEEAFFAGPNWISLDSTGRCGVPALKTRLADLLMTITKKELPHVRADVSRKLALLRKQWDDLGPPRKDLGSQRAYAGSFTMKFQALTQAALQGHYDSDRIFESKPNAKLITTITNLNESFANEFWENGHKRETSTDYDDMDDDESAFDLNDTIETSPSESLHTQYPELSDVIDLEEYECPEPLTFEEDSIMEHIRQVYQGIVARTWEL